VKGTESTTRDSLIQSAGTSALRQGPAALLSAHPGHELRVHGWLESARPVELVLTDGSGGAAASRLASTERLLESAGARPGSWFGRFTDRDIYEAILGVQTQIFCDLAREAAAFLAQGGISVAVTDEAEGYNPAHDLCHGIAAAAVRLASGTTGRQVVLFAHPLAPGGTLERAGEIERLCLADDALARKLEAAARYRELAPEVDAALSAKGISSFRTEMFRRIDTRQPLDLDPGQPAFYEQYGERQVVAGRYRRVLRYREHILPIARALAETSGGR
jgi:hypothetical protein